MPILDSTAQAALGDHFAVAWYIFLDLDGDPLRVTTFGQDTVFSSTGEVDLDGNTFVAFAGSLLDVGDVSNSESGSDTLLVTLSGIASIDTTLLADIGDKTKWQGRLCRIWFRLYDAAGVTPQGAIVSHYTGYMSSVRFVAAPKAQSLQLSVENYLAYTTQASNRSYLNQTDYDSADTSAAATIAAANGLRSHSGGGGASSSTAGGLAGSYQTKPSGGDYYNRAGV
jgi:hypothetical protein